MYFTEAEQQAIQSYIDRNLAIMRQADLEFTAEIDPVEFRRVFSKVPQSNGLPTMFDPEFAYLHAKNFWWAKITDAEGGIVGLAAQRSYDVDDFREFIRHYLLFYDRPILDWRPMEISDALPDLAGRIVMGGAHWLHPDIRGRKLSYSSSQVIQALSLRTFRPDYKVVIYRNEPKYYKLARSSQYTHLTPMMKGPYPPKDFEEMDLLLGWQTRREMVSKLDIAPDEAA